MMRSGGMLVAALVCCGGSLLCIHLAQPAPMPSLWTAHTVFDHGELFQDQEVDATFELINTFQQSLDITEVRKTCGCTNATLSIKHVEPMQRTVCTVRWNTGRSRGARAVDVVLSFTLADGGTGRELLRVKGIVYPDINYSPTPVEFAGDKAEAILITFSPGRLQEFKILKAM